MTLELEQFRPADPTHVWGVDFATPQTTFTAEDLASLGIVDPQFEFQPLAIDPAAKVAFRGGWTCSCVATSLPHVEAEMIRRGLIKRSIDIYQLGWNSGRVAASAGTHDKGMMIDVGQYSRAHLEVWWAFGWAMQHRTRAQGFSGDHGHGGPHGCTHGSPLATWQMEQYTRHGRNGLRSNAPAEGPTTRLPRWDDALDTYLAQQRQELPMDQTTFNKLMTTWAKSPEGKAAIAIASQSATYGHDVNRDRKPETVGQLTAETYRMVAAIKKKVGA